MCLPGEQLDCRCAISLAGVCLDAAAPFGLASYPTSSNVIKIVINILFMGVKLIRGEVQRFRKRDRFATTPGSTGKHLQMWLKYDKPSDFQGCCLFVKFDSSSCMCRSFS